MLPEQVYELLKEQIIDRVYGPGDKLNIDAIAREMKVSSTPVREALARLVAEGLVAAVPYVGFAVSPMPTRKYYEDLYTFRNLLEPWAAAEAARWRPSDVIDEIKAAVEATGRKNLIMAGVTTDVCLVFPAIDAVAEGYKVQAVMDASGSPFELSEDMSRRRMQDAGVVLTATNTMIAELAQNWGTPNGQKLIQLLFTDVLPPIQS